MSADYGFGVISLLHISTSPSSFFAREAYKYIGDTCHRREYQKHDTMGDPAPSVELHDLTSDLTATDPPPKTIPYSVFACIQKTIHSASNRYGHDFLRPNRQHLSPQSSFAYKRVPHQLRTQNITITAYLVVQGIVPSLLGRIT